MKKVFLSLFSLAALASTSQAQLAIAPELGLNMATINGKSGGVSQTTSMKAGLGVGAVVDVAITDNITFQPGLFYEMTGFKQSVMGTDVKVNINTLTIPLNFQYCFGEDNVGFFVGIGPYLGYNISGNISGTGSGGSTTLNIGSKKPDPTTGAGGDDIKALDFGAGLNLGYRMSNGFFARAHYQMGLANLDVMADADNTMHTSAFGVTVGYFFNSAKGHKGGKGGKKK